MTALATKLDERVRLVGMPRPQERPGFGVLSAVPMNMERPAPVQSGAVGPSLPETRPRGEPANVLEMSAHGGAGNAFGYGPLHDNLARVDSALEHVRGPEKREEVPAPVEEAAPRTGAKKAMNMFTEGMLRAYSPLLDGTF